MGNPKNKKIVWSILIVIISSVFIFFLLSLVLLVVAVKHLDASSHPDSSKFVYDIMTKNPYKNETTYGFVRLNRRLQDSEFISYQDDETGDFFIISNLFQEGSRLYECAGSCSCIDQRRSASSSVLSRGLLILLSALSSSLAIKMAKETFTNECVQKYEEVCDPNHIVSMVDWCSQNKDDEDDDSDYKDNFNYEKMKEEGLVDENPNSEFSCTGFCVENEDVRNDNKEAVERFTEDFFPCKKFDLTFQVEPDCTNVPEEFMDVGCLMLARQKFYREGLSPFCKMYTRIRYPMTLEQQVMWKVDGKAVPKDYFYEKEGSVCEGLIKNVKCQIVKLPEKKEKKKSWKDDKNDKKRTIDKYNLPPV